MRENSLSNKINSANELTRTHEKLLKDAGFTKRHQHSFEGRICWTKDQVPPVCQLIVIHREDRVINLDVPFQWGVHIEFKDSNKDNIGINYDDLETAVKEVQEFVDQEISA